MWLEKLTEKVMNQFRFFDFPIFKLYLMSIGVLISMYFPVILELDILFFAILAILMLIVMIPKTLKKNKKASGFFDKIERNAQDRNARDVSLFKVMMVLIWIIAVKLFPQLLELNPLIYRWIALFWASWFISLISHS